MAQTVENKEFTRLKNLSGWKGTQIAKALEISEALVSQYLAGNLDVEKGRLKLFQYILKDAGFDIDSGNGTIHDAPRPLTQEQKELIDDIQQMEFDKQRAFILHLRGLAQLVEKRAISYANSKKVK